MFETRRAVTPKTRSVGDAYPEDMTLLSAHDVAAVLRDRLPGLPTKKLHKLLYYCQGHHLATFDAPLFGETIFAWDMGPVVASLWRQEKAGAAPAQLAGLDEGQLNTVGYVLSRYGALTGRDLENLTHGEMPWRLADSNRRPGQERRIELAWVRDYFKSAVADEDDDDALLDSDAVTAWLQDAGERRSGPGRPDNEEELQAWLTHRA
jgi:uncharacterized phage-associated protein